jgi:L-fucose isomerase-like protein
MLKSLCGNVRVPDDLLLSLDALDAFMEAADPDLIILQNATFANAAYAETVLNRFPDVPILLWGLREPVIDGRRLRLNSLTGSYSAANMIRKYRKEPLEYIFGSPSEKEVKDKVSAVIKAAGLRLALRSLNLAQVGETPQGFGFGKAEEQEMLDPFGVHLENIEAEALMEKAKSFSDEECEKFYEDAKKRIVGLDDVPEQNRRDFVKLYKAYADYVKEKNEYVGYAPGGKQVWHRGEKVLCLVRVQEHHKRCGAETL